MQTRVALLAAEAERPYTQTKPLTVTTAHLDDPGEGEVLVRILAAGICHSDLSVINGDRPRSLPMVLGHESVAEVVRVGPGVHDLSPGQRVVTVFVPSCGGCECCTSGRPALCEPALKVNSAGTLLSGATRLRNDDGPILHLLGVSCFAEHAVCHRRSLVPVDDAIEPAIQAVFGCAVLTGCGAVIHTGGAAVGDRVCIVGLGGVGLAALIGARAAGARQVIAVDANPRKEALAKQLGADAFVLATDPDAAAHVRDLTDGGAHLAAEFAGVMPALQLAVDVTRRGGRTVTAALPHPSDRLQLNVTQLVAEERTLLGSYVGSCVPTRDVPKFMAMYQAGRLPVDQLITHRLPLDEINLGMERLAAGEAVRQIVTFD